MYEHSTGNKNKRSKKLTHKKSARKIKTQESIKQYSMKIFNLIETTMACNGNTNKNNNNDQQQNWNRFKREMKNCAGNLTIIEFLLGYRNEKNRQKQSETWNNSRGQK